MKKMPCLFVRKFDGPRSATITETVTPGCQWVLDGEGVASRKWDGTACAVIGGVLHKRYDAKKHPKTGEYKMPPAGSIACSDPDPTTAHWPHWVKVDATQPGHKYHVAAWQSSDGLLPDGTYELIGPPFNSNPERVSQCEFRRHGDERHVPERSFAGLRTYLLDHAIEGIVFTHQDGRMCKIRRDDFGFEWPLTPKGADA